MTMRAENTVQLITYVDRLGSENLTQLADILGNELSGLFGGAHILPFYYPIDGADAGYDPIDHNVVDQRLGDWHDINALSQRTPLMVDLVVNHISRQSKQFTDFHTQGADSEYADMFGLVDRLFPNGIDENAMDMVSRPGLGSPIRTTLLKNGDLHNLWCSFSDMQVDIDVEASSSWKYLMSILDQMSEAGIALVRLDAVGYTVKTPGTSCFMTKDTVAFIGKLATEVRNRGMRSVLEIHGHFQHLQVAAECADLVYDFCLPPLILHALFEADEGPLLHWLDIAPRNCLTVLDTHDGIGLSDAGPDPDHNGTTGLLTDDQIAMLRENIDHKSDGASTRASGVNASNLDVHQINCTYFDALGGDECDYILARLIQLFSPGIPQIYYMGLFAGRNDLGLLEKTGVGRDINRHYYSRSEINEALSTPVVKRLANLIHFRNSQQAFDGTFKCWSERSGQLTLHWDNDQHSATANIDLKQKEFELSWKTPEQTFMIKDLINFPSDIFGENM